MIFHFFFFFRGKFAQRSGLGRTEIIGEGDTGKFFKLLSDPGKRVCNFEILSEKHMLLEWVYRDNYEPDSGNKNLFLAIFTTSHARLKLYEQLSRIGERAIYCDTG